MGETRISIGRVKRDISEIVNRVAYGGQRVVLTSRGRPKAAIVSMEDYERLEREGVMARLAQWEAWKAERQQLAAAIMERRDGEPLDFDALWDGVRREREERDARIAGR
jgi:prevent-host-death family protein